MASHELLTAALQVHYPAAGPEESRHCKFTLVNSAALNECDQS